MSDRGQTDAASEQLPKTHRTGCGDSRQARPSLIEGLNQRAFVLQDIEKGEELFIDYGGQYDRTSYGTSYNIRSRSVGTRRPF